MKRLSDTQQAFAGVGCLALAMIGAGLAFWGFWIWVVVHLVHLLERLAS